MNVAPRRRLTPKTHLISSIRARNYNLEGLMSELVDNSLGHGKARNVDIVMFNNAGFAVRDNGNGVDDINRMFCVADAGDYDAYSNLGLHGVGAKDAAIWLGDELTVETVRNDVLHQMTANWEEVYQSGLWPFEYIGTGTSALGRTGTTVLIRKPRHRFNLASSERLSKELSLTYAPALRAGTVIRIQHQLKSGKLVTYTPEPFDPELTDEIAIGGEVTDRRGRVMRWHGRAGLSAALTDRFNGVHIALTHRVIETTRDPFGTKSAPTLYCEVTLDADTPWKYALSDHKDRVLDARAALMESIGTQLADLLDKSSSQASYLALKGISVPIETLLTKALRDTGVLYVDPDEEPDEGGGDGDSDNPVKKKRRKLHTPTDDGDSAKPASQPTGVKIDWRTAEQLDGKMWSWDISDTHLVIELDKAEFEPTIRWPIGQRERYIVQMITAFLSHAIEMEWWVGSKDGLSAVLTPKLRNQIDDWSRSHKGIAPHLNRAILKAAV